MAAENHSKRCPSCGEVKPLGEFAPNRSTKTGRSPYCAPCQKAYAREHYRKNRDAYIAKAAGWRGDNPERMQESRQKWVESHGDLNRAVKAAWTKRNREKMNAYKRAWRETNPDKVREYAWLSNQQRRGNDRPDQLARLYRTTLLDDPCSYCGAAGGEIDHIEPIRAGARGEWQNLTASCRSCNARKNAKPFLLFMRDSLIDGEYAAAA